MIKTTAMFSAHAIHVFIRNALIVLGILFVAFLIWLLAGIKVNTLKIGGYSISGLYIKLDKKLTLRSDHITLPQSKAKPSFENMDRVFDGIKDLLTYFESIELKNVKFKNNQLNIIFSDDVLYVTSDDYEIAGNIHRAGQRLEADVSLLYIKKDDVRIKGKLTYDLNSNSVKTEGDFEGYDISGRFFANKIDDIIDFKVESDTFNDLHPIVRKFDLEEGVRSWILDKVKADTYKLAYLSGEGKIDDEEFILDIDALNGEILFSDVKVHFKENLAPVLASKLLLTYHKGEFYFDLNEPFYEGLSLKGSEVSIRNLLNNHTNLKLKIRTDTGFDTRLNNLLKAYNIVLPLDEKSAKVNVLFMADIGLKNHNQDFFAEVNFSQGDIWLNAIRLPIQKGNLQYRNNTITLKNISLKNEQYEGDVNGTIDLKKEKANLVFDAKHVKLGDEKEKYFVLNNKILPLELNYGKTINVDIPKLSLKLSSSEKETTMNIQDLKKIKPYLSNSDIVEEGGNIDVKTKDFKTYQFNGVLKRSSCFLYEKDDQCKIRVPFKGKIAGNDVDFFAFEKRFHYNKARSRVKLENLNIDLEKFLKLHQNNKDTQGNHLVILGKNSSFRYGEYRLFTDSYDIDVKENGAIKAIGSASGNIIKFSKIKDVVSLQALRITDKVLHPLINFEGLQNGRYSIKKSGNPAGTMKGQVIVEGGVMKDFKAYNNTLAFINTLPALASLRKPGFSTEGFTIEEGVVEYRQINNEKIIFDSVYIKGSSANIVGQGELDLKQKTINMNLAIQVARELGKVVGSVPLLGYILMGEDQSVAVGLKITGSLDKPIVTTTGTKELLLLPLDILKRTLQTPTHILSK